MARQARNRACRDKLDDMTPETQPEKYLTCRTIEQSFETNLARNLWHQRRQTTTPLQQCEESLKSDAKLADERTHDFGGSPHSWLALTEKEPRWMFRLRVSINASKTYVAVNAKKMAALGVASLASCILIVNARSVCYSDEIALETDVLSARNVPLR